MLELACFNCYVNLVNLRQGNLIPFLIQGYVSLYICSVVATTRCELIFTIIFCISCC